MLFTNIRISKSEGRKPTFISSVSDCEEEYYLNKNVWSGNVSDWKQRFEVGDVINDPAGDWNPSTAEEYIDQQVATITGNLAGETVARQAADTNLQNQVDTLAAAVGTGGTVDQRIQAEATTRANADTGLSNRIIPLEQAVGTGGSIDTRISNAVSAEQSRAQGVEATKADKATTLSGYGITDTYTKTEVNGLVDTPHQNYVTVQTYSALPTSGSAYTIYRVPNYDGSVPEVNVTKYSEYAWNGSQYIFLCVKSQIDEVFDITVYHSNTTYSDLAAALGTNGANIPSTLRRGGMSIKYVQSSDNKYVQARCMADSFTTDVTQWQVVDNEPVSGSKNLVESGGVAESIQKVKNKIGDFSSIVTVHFDGTSGDFVVNTFSLEKGIPFIYKLISNGVIVEGKSLNHKFTYTDDTEETKAIVIDTNYKFTLEKDLKSIRVWVPYDGGATVVSSGDVVSSITGILNTQSIETLNTRVDNIEDTLEKDGSKYIKNKQSISKSGVAENHLVHIVIDNIFIPKNVDFSVLLDGGEAIPSGSGSYNFSAYFDDNTHQSSFAIVEGKEIFYKFSKNIIKVSFYSTTVQSIVDGKTATFSLKCDSLNDRVKDLEESALIKTTVHFDGTSGDSIGFTKKIPAKRIFTYKFDVDDITVEGKNFKTTITFEDTTTYQYWALSNERKEFCFDKIVSKISTWVPYDGGATIISSGDGTGYLTVYGIDDISKIAKQNKDDISVLKQDEIYPQTTDVFFWNNKKDLLNKIQQIKHYKTVNGRAGMTPIVFAHFSDIHADKETLENICYICDEYKNYIDEIIHTGDSNEDHYEPTSFDFWGEVPAAANILNVIGNHDAQTLVEGHYGPLRTESELYQQFFAPYISGWNVQSQVNKCYYYKDYAVTPATGDTIEGIRLIVLEDSINDSTQYTWLENVLSEARTNNYAVVIAKHHQPGEMNQLDCAFNSNHRYGLDESTGNYPSVVQDFIDNGGEFICWLCGHVHRDKFGTLKDYPSQIVVAVDRCSPETWWTDHACSYGKSKMIMNLIAFDTTDKLIKILRIGNDCDRFMRHIGQMCYRYEAGNQKLLSNY